MAPCSVSVMPICFMPSSSSSRKFTDWSGREGIPQRGGCLGISRPADPEWTRIRRGIPPSLLADIFVHLFCGGFGKAVVQSLYKEMFVRVAFISLFGLFTDGGGEKSYDVGRA